MASWKDMFLDVLRLTDEVKRLNKDIDRVQSVLTDVDKRVVRIEAFMDMAKYNLTQQIDN